jgi:nitrate/TMAO reductase-like tetraheme cytochrome c subunit
MLLLLFLVAGIGSAATLGGVVAVGWTETADFCGRCHTMGPELKAHELSPHREVACAECHVEPGIGGWVRAKINGTRQLIQLLTDTFPEPIPAPDHGDLPPTSKTCVRCHDVGQLVANGGPVKLILRDRFRKDQQNTRDTIALVLRPVGFGGTTATRGVHWHVDSEVDYLSSDPRARTIDWVGIKYKDGTTEQFIALTQAAVSTDVQPDIDRLKSADAQRRMDCIDCHNRIGHGIPSIDDAIDAAISAGRIDQSLPYIKREASSVLSVDYASEQDADYAIDGIRTFYTTRYPLVPKLQGPAVSAALQDLKAIYRLVATPDMQVTASTYPDNLGHQRAPGCFRCHDGAHYKIVDGALSAESIPSACATCHTFPQVGATESGVLIGKRPASHDDRLWVFNHKTTAFTLDPAGTSCGACHTRTYCENCHKTTAVQVPHDDMVYNHARVIDKTGAQACAYCHQPAYCAQCHSNPVLPNLFPDLTPEPSLEPSLSP